jgi:hypothetical protein
MLEMLRTLKSLLETEISTVGKNKIAGLIAIIGFSKKGSIP